MSTNIEEIIRQTPLFKESRLNSLYSNFENFKQLNPEGYQANIQAWKQLISNLIKSNEFDPKSQISLTTYNPNLEQSLTIPIYGEPKKLDGILQELVNKRFLIPESLFLNANGNYGSIVNNSFNFTSINSWLQSRALKNYQVKKKNGNLIDEKYILWDELVRLGDKFQTEVQNKIINSDKYSSTLFTNDLLYEKILKVTHITKQDFKLLLKFISTDLNSCVTETRDGITYIKFIKTDSETITNEDVSIINIKLNLQNLNIRIKELENKLSNINLKSVLSLPKDVQKLKLSRLIKFKKVLISKLDQSIQLQSELYQILNKINDAKFNIEYFEILQSSSKVLNKLNNEIKIEDIEEVRDEIDKEMVKEEEISDALIDKSEAENDDEINEELNKLVKENKQGENKQEEKSAVSEKITQNSDNDEKELLDKLESLELSDEKTKKLNEDEIPLKKEENKLIAE
ncbi:uncharacterized protein KGF55_001335 [Candida pseudojiufengensis]|uniref:uncharacterized protein n=1 Tax=Candida pseudojiufengensis TaxID=497109 RepID=UPI002224881D|nr:uncharacterized protein KGF55_001335 [Candida pseudojiufengensis]KAI5965971.1 hypothetical protein KGF55_001335 [Candida pseudojiufengensis]